MWEASPEVAVHAANLVNTKASMIGKGLEVTKVGYLFGIDRRVKKSSFRRDHLLTRRQSRGVVAKCFSRFALEGSTAAVVGSPGIGKSWLLLYALQQALLYEDAVVMTQASTRSIRHLFIRRSNQIYAWTMRYPLMEGLWPTSLSIRHLRKTLVLYDPPEVSVNGGGASYSEGDRNLMAFLSANDGHDIKKSNKHLEGVAQYLSPPSTDELLLLRPYLLNADRSDIVVSEQEMLDRAEHVGNLPRYLIDETAFNRRIEKRNEAIEKMNRDNNYFLQTIRSGGKAMTMDTLPGTLFTVYPARRRRVEPEDEEIDDMGADSDEDDDGVGYEPDDYDGISF